MPTFSRFFVLSAFITLFLFMTAQSVQAATLTVTNTNDSGPGSLRQAIIDANNSADNDIIEFALSGCPCVITLTSGELFIANNGGLTINGPGASQLSVSGNNTSRVFYILAQANVTINGITVTGGRASGGGGIFNAAGELRLTNSTVSDNEAGTGGGIFSIGGNLTLIINSTVSGNSATNGGGIWFQDGYPILTNSTVTNNSATGFGGGIYVFSYGSVGSSIIAGNTAPNAPDVVGSVTSDGYNLIGIGDAYTSGFTAAGDQVGTSNAPIDAILGPMQDNGGPTMTHALLPGSPAIDAGRNFNSLTTDQRGFARTIDDSNVVNAAGSDGTDIGAVESNFITVNTTAEHNDGACQPLPSGDCTLREATLAANAAAGTETIIFDIPTTDPGYDVDSERYTITLTSVLPDLDSDMSIRGLGADRLIVNRGGGGAFRIFHITSGANVSILGLTISGGLATEGGGIRNDGSLSIAGSVVRDNLTLNGQTSCTAIVFGNGGDGGGIYNGGYLMVDSSAFIGNSTGNGGAGINQGTCSRPAGDGGHGGAIRNSGTMVVRNSTFSGNRTGNGGTMAFQSPPPGLGGYGAAIFSGGSLSISNTTINANQPGFRGVGSVVSSTEVELTSSIVANTVGSNDIRGHFNGDFNLVGTLVVGSTLTGTNNITSLDPILGPLADNGGPTPTHAPLCGSPAIDAGKNVSGFATDQRGFDFARTFDDLAAANAADGDGTDIGAFELQEAAVCNTAPVANDDSYSMDEDTTLNVSAPGVLGNDADGEDDTLIADVVVGPAYGSITLNTDGSFSYTPDPNFNGSDSFTYRANDGSLESNVATVTITVNPVNDAPVVSATPSSQSVQYSDAISPVTISASDVETAAGSLSISFTHTKDGGAVDDGLPSGMNFGGGCGVGKVCGIANVPSGSYAINVAVTDTGDGTSPALTSYATFTVVVNREDAVAAPSLANPVSKQVGSPGGAASGSAGTICFDITELADGSAGDTALIDAATVTISPVGGGSGGSTIASSAVTFTSPGGVGEARTACSTLSLVNTPANVYEVMLTIRGDYYTGTGTTVFTVFDPSAGFASGGGWIINPNTGYRANYGIHMKYARNGNVQGSVLYVEHRPDGDFKVKSTALAAKGAFAIIRITGGAEARMTGKATVGPEGASIGNHGFVVRMIDMGTPGTNDRLGLKVIDPAGQNLTLLTFDPALIGGGNNQVPNN